MAPSSSLLTSGLLDIDEQDNVLATPTGRLRYHVTTLSSSNVSDYADINNSTVVESNDVTGLSKPEVITASVVMCVCIAVTIVGNVLVIMSVFTYRPLRGVQNFYIVSLAVADLAVAILVMPFNVAYFAMRERWAFGVVFCHVWLTADILTCTASILNLCAIALDRYRAIHDPIGYAQRRTVGRVLLSVGAVWTASVLISVPPLIGWNRGADSLFDPSTSKCQLTDDPGFVVYSASGSFYIPLALMTFVYAKIFRATRQRLRSRTRTYVSSTASAVTPFQTACAGHGGIDHSAVCTEVMPTEVERDRKEPAVNECSASSIEDDVSEYVTVNAEDGRGSSTYFHRVARQPSPNTLSIPTVRQPGGVVFRSSACDATCSDSMLSEKSGRDSDLTECYSDIFISLDPSPTEQQTLDVSHLVLPERDDTSRLPVALAELFEHHPGLSSPPNSRRPPDLHTRTSSSSFSRLSSTSTTSTGSRRRRSEVPRQCRCCCRRTSSQRRHRKRNASNYDAGAVPTNTIGSVEPTTAINAEYVLDRMLPVSTATGTGIGLRRALTERPRSAPKRGIQHDGVSSVSCGATGAGGGAGGGVGSTTAIVSRIVAEKQRQSAAKERRVARTMAVIMAAFVVCWLPFFVMYIVFPFCNSCAERFDQRVILFIVWLGYINSTLNPVIYTIFNVDFRRAFKLLLTPRRR